MVQIATTPETSWKEQGHGVWALRPNVSWLPHLFFFSFAYPLYSESIDWACPDYQALDWGCCCCVPLFVTPWTAAHQASLFLIISCPLHQWCHLAISSSDALFSFSPQSFQHQGLFQCLKITGHRPGRLHSPHPKNTQSTESTLRRWWQSRSHYDSCWVHSTFAFVCVCMYMCVCTSLCLILCDPMDCSLPSSSVHGIFQVRILEEVAISFSISLILYLMNPSTQGGYLSFPKAKWLVNSVSIWVGLRTLSPESTWVLLVPQNLRIWQKVSFSLHHNFLRKLVASSIHEWLPHKYLFYTPSGSGHDR